MLSTTRKLASLNIRSAVCGSQQSRSFSRTTAKNSKVCVVGAAGGIGQPLSMLLKLNPLVSELSLFDIAPVTPGVAADLSHIPTNAKVTGYAGQDELGNAVSGCDMVVIPAGVPRKPGMTRDDLFNINASIVAGTAKAIAEHAPNAMILVISNPVNSTVPITREVLKKAGVYNKNRLFGVTSLDVCRANTFVAENQNMDPNNTKVQVVGGHAGTTIVPIMSQVEGSSFTDTDRDALTQRIMFGGDEVVQAKAGGGSATLSMAYAGAYFGGKVLRAINGEEGIVECAFVESDVMEGCDFFASNVELGKDGVVKALPIGEVTEFEQTKLDEMVGDLQTQINKGMEWGKKFE